MGDVTIAELNDITDHTTSRLNWATKNINYDLMRFFRNSYHDVHYFQHWLTFYRMLRETKLLNNQTTSIYIFSLLRKLSWNNCRCRKKSSLHLLPLLFHSNNYSIFLGKIQWRLEISLNWCICVGSLQFLIIFSKAIGRNVRRILLLFAVVSSADTFEL